MKIHFCDLCNESVPQAALDSGSARRIKDRVICAACDAAMSHGGAAHPEIEIAHVAPLVEIAPVPAAPMETPARHAHDAHPRTGHDTVELRLDEHVARPHAAPSPVLVAPVAAPTRSGSNAGLAWVAGIAIAFTAVSIFVTDDRLARVTRAQSALSDEIAKKDDALHGLATEFAKVHPALAGVETRLAERIEADRARNAAVVESMGALREEIGRHASRLDGIAGDVAALRARVDQPGLGTEIEKRFDELSRRIAKADDERRALAEELANVSVVVPVAESRPEAAPTPSGPPPWHKFLADLASKEETVRWDAVTTLGETGDPAVIPHVLPMLKDPTWVVRMAAARALGEKLHAREAVPDLITMLEDEDSAVRETAWIQLRVITGKDFKFDSYAPDAERAKRVKVWSDWWKKDGATEAPPKPPAGS